MTAIARGAWGVLALIAACTTVPRGTETASGGRSAPPVAEADQVSSAPARPKTASGSPMKGDPVVADSGSPRPSEPHDAGESLDEEKRGEAATAGPLVASTDPTPRLFDEQGKPLPQTEARPSTDSAAFVAGGRLLFDAIVADDAERALPFFFPAVAYEQVKDIANPKRDWEWRLVGAFRRNIHEYHRLLGKARDQAKYLRIEVPEDRALWMKPGSEGNKLGYFRVLRSRLVYADAEGRERGLEITSFISWRGEWYVVHLNGFK